MVLISYVLFYFRSYFLKFIFQPLYSVCLVRTFSFTVTSLFRLLFLYDALFLQIHDLFALWILIMSFCCSFKIFSVSFIVSILFTPSLGLVLSPLVQAFFKIGVALAFVFESEALKSWGESPRSYESSVASRF